MKSNELHKRTGFRIKQQSATSKAIDYFVNQVTSEPEEKEENENTAELDFQTREKKKCADSPEYFINEYCYLFDTDKSNITVTGMKGGRWIPFTLWEDQIEVLTLIIENQKVVVLKARQNGLTWLALAYALWQCLFEPIAIVLVYSLRDDEAIAMLGEEKLDGMFKRLPEWMKITVKKSKHLWAFENGSAIRALPTTAGDSYTATMAIVDEADLIPDLNDLLQRVKPTIDAGGKLVLISRSNKKKPKSLFKKIYIAAKEKKNDFMNIFLPWFSRKNRTAEWYEKQKASVLAETGVLDNLYESYPASDQEALAPSTLDKRFSFEFLKKCSEDSEPLDVLENLSVPMIPGLRIYELPIKGEVYCVGGDPAEGNPNSDDSACSVVHKKTGRQVAVFNGKHEPSVFADYIAKLSKFYNNAGVLCERNNHGHTVIYCLSELKIKQYQHDDKKAGYLSNKRTKVELYDGFAESLKTDDVIITDFETFNQLAGIEGNTLLAPEGEFEDCADSMALANIARTMKLMNSENRSGLGFGKSKGWTYVKKR